MTTANHRTLGPNRGLVLIETLIGLTVLAIFLAAVTRLLIGAQRATLITKRSFEEIEHETTWSVEKLATASCQVVPFRSEVARICTSSQSRFPLIVFGQQPGSGTP